MNKKFELIPQEGTHLFRIRALRDFSDVKAGDLGGFVEKEDNLSHNGDCWIYDDARVFHNAFVYNDACIYNKARVYGFSRVNGYAQVMGNVRIGAAAQISNYAKVEDSACVFGDAHVFHNAHIYEAAVVSGDARVFNNASVFGNARVYEKADVSHDAQVYGNAHVFGVARVYKNVHVLQYDHIRFGHYAQNTLVDLLRCSLGVHPTEDGYVYVYKRVNIDYTSEHDRNFVYPKEGLVEAKEYDADPTKSCASGLHFSTNEYWPIEDATKQRMLLAEVHIDDIIACQEGKIRVKKAYIINRSQRSKS